MPKIRFRRGQENKLPTLLEGEPGFTTDTKKLFVGSATGNIELAKQTDLDSANAEVLAARGGEVTLGARLDNVTSELAQIAKQIKSIGVVPDDPSKATANAIALNNYFATNSNKTVLCSNENYYIDNTIVVTSNNKLIGQKSTKFILSATSKDAFRLKPFASIESISIELPANHNKVGIMVGNNDDFSQWSTHHLSFIRDIFIYGNVTRLSTGLHCEAIDGYAVTNFSADNVTILNCKYGIYLGASGTGWVNGNNFINVYPQNCEYGIYNLGSGNKFIYSVQMGSSAVSRSGVYCGGNENLFSGKVWDTANGSLAVETSSESVNNTFEGQAFPPNIVQRYVMDRGTNNYFVGDYLTKQIPSPQGAYRYNSQDTSKLIAPSWANHFGIADDLLMFCDKTGTVTSSNGDGGISTGSLSDLFSNKGMTFNNTSVGNPIVIEIILPSPINFIDTFGITFHSGLNAGNIKMEWASSSGGAYNLATNISNNINEYVVWSLGSYGSTIQKLKFTLSQGVINTLNNPLGLIGIWNIFMFGNGYNGNLYLPRSGGDIYGDLQFFQNKGVIVKTPDGSKKYRISVDNSGVLTTTLIP